MNDAKKSISGDVETARQPLGKVRQVAGHLDASGLRFGIVVSRYNETLTGCLVRTAVQRLLEQGAKEKRITVAWVPGAYEVPSVIHRMAATGRYDALIALGVVIQGETPHAELINNQVAHSLAQISREQGIPVIDSVVAARNVEQAEARCTPDENGRGWYAAGAAIEMARVFRRLDREHA